MLYGKGGIYMGILKKYSSPLIMLVLFETIAVTLWLTMDNIFYLFNFSYIGGSIAVGLFLYIKKFKYARQVVQFAVGSYMLVYLGLLSNENMQIEGFWFYLFSGVFEAATIHYAVAKIFGPLFFGRGWCGYACWTAMILDLLPYKQKVGERKNIGYIRYILFLLSFLFVGALFVWQVPNMEKIMFWSFLIGNVVYYAVGMFLAFRFRDNRAFCKYICPITVFLKPMSRHAAVHVAVDTEKCISCGKCRKVCPMGLDISDQTRRKENASECILCMNCVEQCPKKALKM